MASLWLEDITHEAVPTTLVLRITQVETLYSLSLIGAYPENRDLARVSGHGLHERPDQQYEEYMKES